MESKDFVSGIAWTPPFNSGIVHPVVSGPISSGQIIYKKSMWDEASEEFKNLCKEVTMRSGR